MKFLALAGAAATKEDTGVPSEVLEAKKRTKELVASMVNAIATHRFEKARAYSVEERKAREH